MRCKPWRQVVLAALALAALVLVALSPQIDRHVRAAGLLRTLSETPTSPNSVTSRATELQIEPLTLSGRRGPIRSRLYRDMGARSEETVVLIHGVHHLGIDEPRLVTFARALAHSGIVVVTPQIEDLTRYRMTERSIDDVSDSVTGLSEQVGPQERLGLLGFSFAGGLSLLASTQPGTAPHLSYVASVGGHHDLSRVLRYFLNDRIETPRGTINADAHEYGLVVLMYECLDRLVSPVDFDVASTALEAWLKEDRARARELAATLSTPEAQRLFAALDGELSNTERTDLHARLSIILKQRSQHLARLSPQGKLATGTVPVYLLHGSGDSVIPPSETEWAALELGERRHRALVTPLIQHVEVTEAAGWLDQWRLLEFMAQLL